MLSILKVLRWVVFEYFRVLSDKGEDEKKRGLPLGVICMN